MALVHAGDHDGTLQARSKATTTRQIHFPDIGLPGWTVLSWTLAGGIATGGAWVLLLEMMGAVDPLAAGPLAEFLFFFGAAVGALHGLILGLVGRPEGMSYKDAVISLGWGLVLAVPMAFVARWMAHGIAEVPAAQALGGLSGTMFSSLFWGAGAGIALIAAAEGYRSLRHAYRRWPDWKVGSVLLFALLGFLAYRFLQTEPALWGTDIHVTGAGAVLLALGATLWLGAPAIIAGLMVAHRLRADD